MAKPYHDTCPYLTTQVETISLILGEFGQNNFYLLRVSKWRNFIFTILR